MLIPREAEVVAAGLRYVGMGILIPSTIGALISHYYFMRRREAFHTEISWFISEVWRLLRHPEETFNIQSLANLEQAEVEAFYPNRGEAAVIADIQSELELLSRTDADTEICLLGDTLRVFFHPGNPYTNLIYAIVTNNPKVTFKVLIANPYSSTAYYKSLAETAKPFKDYDDYKNRSAFFQESEITRSRIEGFNEMATQSRKVRSPRIELRYYECADMCVAILFPNSCYTAQYLYGNPDSQVNTVNTPMIKYSRDSNAYERIKYHFDFIWLQSIPPEAVHCWKLDIKEGRLKAAAKNNSRKEVN
jgi:hypothetical protein